MSPRPSSHFFRWDEDEVTQRPPNGEHRRDEVNHPPQEAPNARPHHHPGRIVNVDDIVAEKIAAARRRAEAAKARRTALNAARQRGLAHRHAQRLRNQAAASAAADITEKETS